MTVEKKHQPNLNLTFVRIAIVILGVLFLSLVVSRLVYPFGAGTWEAFTWMPATHLLEGHNPYSYAFTPPYSMLPYGIVYYVLMAIGVKLFGFQMWFGRVLSVFAFAVCVWSVVRITKKVTSSKEAALIVILGCLAMFPAQIWIAVMRSDLTAAAFGLSAIWLVFGLEETEPTRIWRVAGMILLALAAMFTKQTYLLPTLIIFLRFLQLKKWRTAVCFAFAVSTLTVGIMFALNYTSSGGYFWQHFIHAGRLPFSLANSLRVFIEMLKQPTFFFSIVLLVIFAFRKRTGFQQIDREKMLGVLRSPKVLLLFYLVVSAVWAFLSTARQGGSAAYYLENSFVLAVGCGLVYDEFKRELSRKWTLATITLLVFGGAFQFAHIFRGEYFRWQSLSYYQEIFDTTAKLTPPHSTCLSIYPELAVWNGCAFNFDDFEEYDGTWSPELHEIFEREIKSGNFAIIIWYDDKLQAKFPNYRLVPMSQKTPERFFPVYLYVRRNLPSQ